MAFGVAALLYAALLLALRGERLSAPAGGIHLLPALIQFFFPVTIAELVLIAVLAATAIAYYSARPVRHPSVAALAPWTSSAIFSKRNLIAGWSLLWRWVLVSMALAMLATMLVSDQGVAIAAVVAVGRWIAVAVVGVWLAKRLVKRSYGITLKGYGWALL